MNTAVLVGAGVLVIAGSSWFTRRTIGRPASAPLISLILPLALLFVAAPIPVASLQVVQAFQLFADDSEAGSRAFAAAAAFALTQPFWYGALAGLFVLMLATAIDVTRQRAARTTAQEIASGRTSGAGWLAVGSALLAAPLAALLIYVGQLAPLLVDAAERALPEAGSPVPVDPERLAAWSAMIANRLVAGVVGGGLLVGLVLTVAVVLTLTMGRQTVTPRHAAVARAAGAAVTCALAAHAAVLGMRLY